jgi:hypothetical protein
MNRFGQSLQVSLYFDNLLNVTIALLAYPHCDRNISPVGFWILDFGLGKLCEGSGRRGDGERENPRLLGEVGGLL